MARDYYADGYEVAERLIESGHRDWSERISAVIEGGSTATEILMGLRWQLSQLIQDGPQLDSDTAALVEDLRNAIDQALS